MKNYYKILNISSNATSLDIKKAYRTLAKKWHPDACSDDNAQEMFVEITEAYEILIDEQKRAEYDLLLQNSFSNDQGTHAYTKHAYAKQDHQSYSDSSYKQAYSKHAYTKHAYNNQNRQSYNNQDHQSYSNQYSNASSGGYHNGGYYTHEHSSYDYKQAEDNYRRAQEEARYRAQQYAKMALEELLATIIDVGIKAVKYTALGEKDLVLTFKDRFFIGLKGVLLIVMIIMTLTGFLAPIGAPLGILLFKSLLDKGRYIGIVNLLTSTLSVMVLGIVSSWLIFATWTLLNPKEPIFNDTSSNSYYQESSQEPIYAINDTSPTYDGFITDDDMPSDDETSLESTDNQEEFIETEHISEDPYPFNINEDEAEEKVVEQMMYEGIDMDGIKSYRSEIIYPENEAAYNFNEGDVSGLECYVVTCLFTDRDSTYEFYVDKMYGNIYYKSDMWYQLDQTFGFSDALSTEQTLFIESLTEDERKKYLVAEEFNCSLQEVMAVPNYIVDPVLSTMYELFTIRNSYSNQTVVMDQSTYETYFYDKAFNYDFGDVPPSIANVVYGLQITLDHANMIWDDSVPIVPVEITNISSQSINLAGLGVWGESSSSSTQGIYADVRIDLRGYDQLDAGESCTIDVVIEQIVDSWRDTALVFYHLDNPYDFEYRTYAHTRTSY